MAAAADCRFPPWQRDPDPPGTASSLLLSGVVETLAGLPPGEAAGSLSLSYVGLYSTRSWACQGRKFVPRLENVRRALSEP